MKRKIFSKPLTQTDISKKLAIPTKSLVFFPCSRSRPTEFLVKDESSGHRWMFACSISKKGYKKPVFQRGWRDFVDFNNLSVGDVVTLYEQESEDGIMLFGKFIPRLRSYAIEVEKAAVASSGSTIAIAATAEAAAVAATKDVAGEADAM